MMMMMPSQPQQQQQQQQQKKTTLTVLVDLDNIAYYDNVYNKACLASRLTALFATLPMSKYRYNMYCNVHTSKFLIEHGFNAIMPLVDVAHSSDKDAADHALISQYLMLVDRKQAHERVTIVTADKNLARLAYYFHRPPTQLRFGTFKAGGCKNVDLHNMERFPLAFNDRNDMDTFVNSLLRFYKYQNGNVKKVY